MTLARLARRGRDTSFATKLIILLVTLSTVPLGVLALYNETTNRQQVLAAARAQNYERAHGTVQVIEAFVSDAAADLRAYALSPDLVDLCAGPRRHESRVHAEAMLRQAVAHQGFAGLYVTDHAGRVLASTSGRYPVDSYQTDRPFLNAVAGRTLVDDPIYDPAEDRAYLRASTAVLDAGTIVGTLVGLLPLEALDRIVARDTSYGGHAEYGVLWTDEGLRLSHPNNPALRFTPLAPLAADVELSIRQRIGDRLRHAHADHPLTELRERSRWLLYDAGADPHVPVQIPTIGAAHVTVVPMAGQRWLYGIFVPETPLLATVRRESLQHLSIALLMLVAALAASLTMAEWATKPLRRISEAARALAAGDMHRRVRLERRDEFGGVAEAFDRMADSLAAKDAELRGHAAELEWRVRERTEALRYLEQVSLVLSSSLDVDRTIASLADLTVPSIAEVCTVDLFEDHGRLTRMRVTAQGAPAGPGVPVPTPAAAALRFQAHTGPIPTVITESAERLAAELAAAPEGRDALRALDLAHVTLVPLRAADRRLGFLCLARSRARGAPRPDDVSLAGEIGRRAAVALANAALFRQAQEANRVKDEFLGTVSHELRTPLNAILGWARLLLSQPHDEAAARRAIETIERNARAQAQLVDDLLDVSRITTGKLVLDRQSVDLVLLVEAAMHAARPAADGKQLKLETRVDAPVALVSGDPNRLQQVVWNLVSNAVKFTPHGGRVTTRVRVEGGQAVLAVEDDGIGIDGEFLPFVFERFRQADSTTTRSHGGLGLGLALVRHIVEMHGGTVLAESDGPDRGSRFTVRLPGAVVPVLEGSVHPISVPQRLDGLHVLVVDDQADARLLLEALLTSSGARVTSVASAAQTMSALEDGAYHVVLADVGMPGEDGYALIRRIRSSPAAAMRCTPVVAVTAYVAPQERDRALAAGFDEHVGKPLDPDRLLKVLLNVTGRGAPV